MPFSLKKKKVVSLLNLHTTGFLFSAFKLIFFLLACDEPDESFDSMPKSEMAPAAAEKLSGQEMCENTLITGKEKKLQDNYSISMGCIYSVCLYIKYIYQRIQIA